MFKMVPVGREMLLRAFNIKVLAWCMGSPRSRSRIRHRCSHHRASAEAACGSLRLLEELLHLRHHHPPRCLTEYRTIWLEESCSPVGTATCTHLEGTTKGLQTLRIHKLIELSSGMRVKHWCGHGGERGSHGQERGEALWYPGVGNPREAAACGSS